MLYLGLALALIAVVAVAWLGWRLLSQHRSAPCPTWLGRMVERDNPFTKVNRAAVIVEQLAIDPGMQVLDAGCGPGRLTLPLAEAVGAQGRVLALDLQRGMLDRVRVKVKAAGFHNVAYLQACLGDGKLVADTYDRAVLVTVLGEIPDQTEALRELYSALKPGGILSITEVIFDPHFQRRKKVLELATAVGFHETARFGGQLAYTLHLQKPQS